MKRVDCFYCNTRISEAHKFCKECGRENIFYKEPVEEDDLKKSLELISSIVKNTTEKFIKKYNTEFYTNEILIRNKPLLVASEIYHNFAESLMFFIDLANQLKDIEGINITKDITHNNRSFEINIMLDVKDKHFRIFSAYIGVGSEFSNSSKLDNKFNKHFKYIYQQLLSMEDLFKVAPCSYVSDKPVADILVEIVNKQYQTAESSYKVLLKAKRTVDRVLKESE